MATRKKVEETTPEVQEQAQVNAEAVEANAEVAALKAKIAALETEAKSRDAAIQALVEENNALRAAAEGDKPGVPDLRPYMVTLKGKQYLTVAGRLVWFNAVNADGHIGIETHFDVLDLDKKVAVCTCTLRDRRDGTILAQATKMEDARGFGDFAEKAQTGSLGRALALIGIGTQFVGADFDEGERIVDTPQAKRATAHTCENGGSCTCLSKNTDGSRKHSEYNTACPLNQGKTVTAPAAAEEEDLF